MPFTVFKRGRVYHYRGTVGRKRFRGSTGAISKEEALAYTATFEAKARKGRADGPEAILTFDDAVEKYLAAEKPARFTDKPRVYFRDTLVKDIPPGLILQAAIEVYPHAAPATRNRQFVIPAVAIINHSAALGLCKPIRVTRFKVDTKLKEPITPEWVREFASHAPPHMGALALFMFGTGARISEALRVQWADLNLQAGTVKIRQTKQRNEREARLHPEVVAAMANLPKLKDRGPFFYATRGAALNMWVKTIERAGLEYRSFHGCRHGFATTLLQRNVDVMTVAKLGGWSTPRHVFETYGHASEDRTLVDRLFDTNETQQAAEKPATKLIEKGKS